MVFEIDSESEYPMEMCSDNDDGYAIHITRETDDPEEFEALCIMDDELDDFIRTLTYLRDMRNNYKGNL
jgi:hypothetical protein